MYSVNHVKYHDYCHKIVEPHGRRPPSQLESQAAQERRRSRERGSLNAYQIAIDGPAASGKSTVARLVAAALGGFYVNTGDMYRAVTWKAMELGIDPDREPEAVISILEQQELRYQRETDGKLLLYLNNVPVVQAEIRSPRVARQVSAVARIPEVREWLKERQRETRALGLVVMEGRDIGTVIFPEAEFKFFVTASPEERARRRLAQPGEIPEGATVATVAAELAERDRIDSSRPVAPLRAAADAVLINTDGMGIAEVVDAIVCRVQN